MKLKLKKKLFPILIGLLVIAGIAITYYNYRPVAEPEKAPVVQPVLPLSTDSAVVNLAVDTPVQLKVVEKKTE